MSANFFLKRKKKHRKRSIEHSIYQLLVASGMVPVAIIIDER